MSTGGSFGDKLGGGYIEIDADLTNFRRDIGKLPQEMRVQAQAAMAALQKELARVNSQIGKVEARKIDPGDAAALKAQADELFKLESHALGLRDAIHGVSVETQKEAAAAARAAEARKAQAQATRDAANAAKQLAADQKKADLAAQRDTTKAANAAQAQAKADAIQASREQAKADREAAQAARLLASEQKKGDLAAQRQAKRDAAAASRDQAKADREAAAAAKQLAQEQRRAAAEATRAQAQAQIGPGAAAGQKGSKGGNLGYGALMLSQTIEDAQYGISAIVNNIPGLVLAMGGGAGLAAAASLSAVAISQLSGRFKNLKEVLGFSYIRSITEEIKELGDVADRTAAQAARLSRLEIIQHNIEAQRGPTDKVTERQNVTNEAIRNAGFPNVQGAIERAHGAAFRNAIDQNVIDDQKRAQNRVANRQADLAAGTAHAGSENWISDLMGTSLKKYQEQLAAANEAVTKAYGDMVAKAIAEIGTDEKKLRDFIAKIKLNPDEYGPDAGKLIKDLSSELPETRRKEWRKKQIAERLRKEREADAAIDEFEEAERQRFLDKGAAKVEYRSREASKRTPAIGVNLGYSIMEDIAAGVETNAELLQKRIADAMKLSGETEENIQLLAPEIAYQLTKGIRDSVRDRAQREGVSLTEAGRREARDEAEASRSRRMAEAQREIAHLRGDPQREEQALERRLAAERRALTLRPDFVGPVLPEPGEPEGPKVPRRGARQIAADAAAFRANAREAAARRRAELRKTRKGRAQLAKEEQAAGEAPAPPTFEPPAPPPAINPDAGKDREVAERKEIDDATKLIAKNTADSLKSLRDIFEAIGALDHPARVGP